MSEPDPGALATPATRRTPAGWIAPAALVISLVAAGAAGWSLVKSAPPAAEPEPALFSGPRSDNPKQAACQAADLVATGVMRQSQLNLGPEPVALETVAANTRLAMAGGAAYLRDNVPVNTPPELASPIAALAGQLQDIAQHFFVGQTSTIPEQSARLTAADESTKRIAELCV